MAIVYTYPQTTDLQNNDLFIVSKMNEDARQTMSLSASDLANFIAPLVPGAGTVTGTGTTNTLPIWTDGPNGVLGDSPVKYDTVTPKVIIDPDGTGSNTYNFGPVSFQSPSPQVAGRGFDFKSQTFNGGFYRSGGFRFEKKLAVGRANDPTGATLDVGTSGDTDPAAWFRNGVVISNNPGGVEVDNTSMVIGAGNNDIISGSDNCLAVGNNNQIENNSDHSVVFGLGNTIQNTASASLVVGQGNTLDGTGLGPGTTARSYILGLNNTLTGSFASFIAGGQNVITTGQNAMVLGFNNQANGVDNVYALGESNTLNDANANGVFMIGNGITGQDGNMVLGYRNDTTGYPATDYALGLGNTKLVLSVGSVNDSNAIIITEGGVTRGGGGVAQVPRVFLPTVTTFSANTDAAADALGVPEGGLYQNNGVVQINRGGGSAVDPLTGGGSDVKKLDVTVTSAQMLSLNGGNVIQLLAAPGANKMYYILNALINLSFNTVVYDFSAAGLSDVVTLQLGTESLFNDNGLSTVNLNSATSTYFIGDPVSASATTQVPVNVPINLTATSGISVSQGNSDLNFSILYREIDLSF